MKPQTASRFTLVLVAALSIGCTGSDPVSDDTSTTVPPTEGVVTATDDSALVGSHLALPEDGIDPPVSVEITADQITYRSTCNAHFGGYELADGVLEFDGGVTTAMACDEPASMTAVGSVLTGRPTVEISEEMVVLTTSTQTLILRSVATAGPVQPIERRWEIVSVFLGATAQWGTTLTTAHIEIGTDEILIDGPCTDGVVSIERSGRELTVVESDFAPLPCGESGTELEDALATIFEPTGVKDFTIVTTARGIDLVPALAPPEHQLDPTGLSLRPDASTPTSVGDASPLPSGALDGPVIRYPLPPDTDIGMAALILGTVELDGDCLYLRGDVGDVRYPVLWPFGTQWDETGQTVILPNGLELSIGATVEGGGGFLGLTGVATSAGDEAAQAAARCGGGEVAVFNNQADAATPA